MGVLMIDDRIQRVGEWFWIEHNILDQHGSTLGPYGLAVYSGLVRCVTGDKQPFIGEIARLTRIPAKRVIKELERIRDLGLLTIARDEDGNLSFYLE